MSLWNTLLNKDTLDGKLEEEIGAAVESLVDGMLKPSSHLPHRWTTRDAGGATSSGQCESGNSVSRQAERVAGCSSGRPVSRIIGSVLRP